MNQPHAATLPMPAHIAILTQQVSNYHAARYRAARREFDSVAIISVLNAADFREFLAEGMDEADVIRICDGQTEYESSRFDGTLWTRVQNALDSVAPDVVVAAGWSFPESMAAIAWARDNGRGIVVLSASQAHDGVRTFWKEQLKSRVVGACDAALVAATAHKDYMVRLGIRPEAVFLGYDAVDNEHFRQGASAARSDAALSSLPKGLPERYFLASGRFIAKKNFPRLVHAFALALKVADHGHHLVILGDGDERKSIEAAIAKYSLGDRIHLPGFRSYDDLPAWYGLSEGFVHVSLTEQWGLVVNEAAAAGVPLLVSRPCGSATTLVHPEVNGWLIDPEDTYGMAEAIAELMTLSPERRAEMGGASERIVTDWGPERFASGLRGAAEIAIRSPRRKLTVWDRALFQVMARFMRSNIT